MTTDDRPTWLVAVDDDPTGCQSVSGVPLLAAWDDDTLAVAARRCAPVTFVLTNSRSMPEAEAVRVNAEVGAALRRAADAEGVRLRLISRSDSTLRGHHPAETEALARGASVVPAATVLCPAFFEAGRFTADGIHWVERDGECTPVAHTEFARDATFGFDELTLAEWARNRGAVDVIDVSVEELSTGEPAALASRIGAARPGCVIVVNATNYDHLRAFDAAAKRAEEGGARFVYRTGPSFVRAAAGLDAPAIADLVPASGKHGLIVVGSHTAVTNAQVDDAVSSHGLEVVELEAPRVIDHTSATSHASEVAGMAVRALQHGSVVLRTSRAVLAADGDRTALDVSRTVAAAMTESVRRIADAYSLGWLIAKGGITSHELLTSAFGVRTAEVAGQALPGVIPVLEIEVGDVPMPYVIFPGNVGDSTSLTRVVERLISR